MKSNGPRNQGENVFSHTSEYQLIFRKVAFPGNRTKTENKTKINDF